jgi:hypothetical protein
MAGTTYLNWHRSSFLEFAALQLRQVLHPLYLSGRLNPRAFAGVEWLRPRRRATHIHRCPREPRDAHRANGSWSPPANPVRSVTASSSFESMIPNNTVLCQNGQLDLRF